MSICRTKLPPRRSRPASPRWPPRRHHRAEGRSRHRQDHLCARLHPRVRQPGRGPEPDLHAGAGLRCGPDGDLAFRSVSAPRPRGGLGARHRGCVHHRHLADRMARAAGTAAARAPARNQLRIRRWARRAADLRWIRAKGGKRGWRRLRPMRDLSEPAWPGLPMAAAAIRAKARNGRLSRRVRLGRASRPVPLAGDASFRRYYRLGGDGRRAVLMDAPPPQEDVGPYIAVATAVARARVQRPRGIRRRPRARLSADRGFRRRHLHPAARPRRRRAGALYAGGRHADRAAARRRGAREPGLAPL